MYGTWISPQGEVIEIDTMCGHAYHLSYIEAKEEGWIATIERKTGLFCARYSRETVTKQALQVLLRRFKQQPNELIVEGLYGRPVYFGLGKSKTHKQAIAFLNKEIKDCKR